MMEFAVKVEVKDEEEASDKRVCFKQEENDHSLAANRLNVALQSDAIKSECSKPCDCSGDCADCEEARKREIKLELKEENDELAAFLITHKVKIETAEKGDSFKVCKTDFEASDWAWTDTEEADSVEAATKEAACVEAASVEAAIVEAAGEVPVDNERQAPVEESSLLQVSLRRSTRATRTTVYYAPAMDEESDATDEASDWEENGNGNSIENEDEETDEDESNLPEAGSLEQGQSEALLEANSQHSATSSASQISGQPVELPPPCPECGKQFVKSPYLKKHMIIHLVEKPHQCNICGRPFADKGSMKKHKLTHSGSKAKPYECDTCGRPFSNQGNLRKHALLHTGNKPYKCTQCPKAFHREDLLNLHNSAVHLKERPFKCSHCEKRFILKVQATRHELTHLPIAKRQSFVCQVDGCGQKFTTKCSRASHMLSHQGIKPFSCGQCGKSFGGRGNLTVHLRRHSGERPYKCTVCPKAFPGSAALTRHEAIHRSERARPFVCSVTGCGKTFPRNSELNRHRKIVHKV